METLQGTLQSIFQPLQERPSSSPSLHMPTLPTALCLLPRSERLARQDVCNLDADKLRALPVVRS
jgi:hypothetical protein